MRINILMVLSVLASLGMFWLVTRRKREEEREHKRSMFQSIKLRVTGDVLVEYESEAAKAQPRIEKVQGEVKKLEDEVTGALNKENDKKAEVNACENDKVRKSPGDPHVGRTSDQILSLLLCGQVAGEAILMHLVGLTTPIHHPLVGMHSSHLSFARLGFLQSTKYM